MQYLSYFPVCFVVNKKPLNPWKNFDYEHVFDERRRHMQNVYVDTYAG